MSGVADRDGVCVPQLDEEPEAVRPSQNTAGFSSDIAGQPESEFSRTRSWLKKMRLLTINTRCWL